MEKPATLLAIDIAYADNGAADAAANAATNATTNGNNKHAYAAGVVFHDWSDDKPEKTCISHISDVAEYVPGEFYKRELPCILQLLAEHDVQPDCIIIDGYVYLDGSSQPGLGWHLYQALGGKVAIIGVAKSSFSAIDTSFGICRGDSIKPLYITSIGMDQSTAQASIAAMHGSFRIPTLLKLVDQLCREAVDKPA
ncbi:endonuclease V [Undibacterium sp. Di27W]|uniref:endonuclease V n=1 Tax=Undibacterium sp. Di27W TaxID=3413036 RepID=UPI003BF1104B